MVRNQKISQYRERLDNTLASPDLCDEKLLAGLVKNQLQRSMRSENEGCIRNLTEKHTVEVSKFLEMLRSVSVPDKEAYKVNSKVQTEWKLKQDSEDCRVMYREGPQGTPFHTLLVEGYVDAPMDVCLCVSWESALYKKWWPQYNIPTFKIISCECSQKVQTGEQLAAVRVKLSWPLSDREAIVHYTKFEYFQDDLIVVLINSVSDSEIIDKSFLGVSKDGAAEAKDMVRIDMVGGFALQKVTPERSFFRTITNMDVKLDFVPPSLINFISRQLLGNGFRLFQKAVASANRGNEDFSKALGSPLYARIREALYSDRVEKKIMEAEDVINGVAHILPNVNLINTRQVDVRSTDWNGLDDHSVSFSLPVSEIVTDQKALGKIKEEICDLSCNLSKEHLVESNQADVVDTSQKVLGKLGPAEILPESEPYIDKRSSAEIEEELIRESSHFEENCMEIDQSLAVQFEEESHLHHKRAVFIRPAVEQALDTLEKIISLVQNVGLGTHARFPSGITPHLGQSVVENNAEKTASECRNYDGTFIEASYSELAGKTTGELSSGIHESRHVHLSSSTGEANLNRIAEASTDHSAPVPHETDQVGTHSFELGKSEAPGLAETVEKYHQADTAVMAVSESSPNSEISPNGKSKLKKHMKQSLCCMHFMSKKVMAGGK